MKIEWTGYFKGVKQNFVFFRDAEGEVGGIGFGVFEATSGKKLFEDVATSDGFHSLSVAAGKLTLRYTRVYRAPCSLYEDAEGCWPVVQQKTGITNAQGPNCIDAYKQDVVGKAYPNTPSVVMY